MPKKRILTVRDLKILRAYIEDPTLTGVAKQFNVSKQAMHQSIPISATLLLEQADLEVGIWQNTLMDYRKELLDYVGYRLRQLTCRQSGLIQGRSGRTSVSRGI